MCYNGGVITLAGSLESGSVSVRCSTMPEVETGTFTVNGTAVRSTICWRSALYTETCTGSFANDNSMSGTLVEERGNTSGTGTAPGNGRNDEIANTNRKNRNGRTQKLRFSCENQIYELAGKKMITKKKKKKKKKKNSGKSPCRA